jgi:hypothetical protein
VRLEIAALDLFFHVCFSSKALALTLSTCILTNVLSSFILHSLVRVPSKEVSSPQFVKDQFGNFIDSIVAHQRHAEDARVVAAAKQKKLEERKKKAKF